MVLKIERDKIYVNGNGQKVRILCLDNKKIKDYPVLGEVEVKGVKDTLYYEWVSYTHQGLWNPDRTPNDLVKEYVPEDWRWFCVCTGTQESCVYPNERREGFKNRDVLVEAVRGKLWHNLFFFKLELNSNKFEIEK